MPTKPLRACLASFRRPPFRPPRCAGRAHLAQTKQRQTLRGRSPEAEQKLVYATQAAPVADLFNQKVEGTAWKEPSWYVLATQDQTVPGSATFCLETDEGRHDRSHVISRSHAIEPRCGPRCHPQGREHGLSVLIPVVHFGCWPIAAPDVCDGTSAVGGSRHRIPSTSVRQPTEPCLGAATRGGQECKPRPTQAGKADAR